MSGKQDVRMWTKEQLATVKWETLHEIPKVCLYVFLLFCHIALCSEG